jgi:hypothetical protein
MPDLTHRLSLPYLVAGQAQKEVTHNEALTLLDSLVQPVVVEVGPAAVPSAPVGAWTGKAGSIASWTSGGWRFCEPREGMIVWSLANTLAARRTSSAWVIGSETATTLSIGGQQVIGPRSSAIPDPSGGANVDANARLTLVSILTALRAHGLIAP